MIIKFNTYNESVRSLMKPKSKEDIEKSINWLNPRERMIKGIQLGLLWMVQDALDEGVNREDKNLYLRISIVFSRDIDIVKAMIDSGANVNYNNDESLVSAVIGGYTDIVELLLRRGANVKSLFEYEHDDDCAYEYAEKQGFTDIINLINNSYSYKRYKETKRIK